MSYQMTQQVILDALVRLRVLWKHELCLLGGCIIQPTKLCKNSCKKIGGSVHNIDNALRPEDFEL